MTMLPLTVLAGAAAIEPPRSGLPGVAEALACRADPPTSGRILVLPGIRNTRFHLAGFVRTIAAQNPGFEIEIRTWGTPLLGISNLRAWARNLATAAALAAEIAKWRSEHPRDPFYLVGYSGGGGIAALVAAELPPGASIDRLVLVAPAISAEFPIVERVMPKVTEFAVNYSSRRDLQVGLGTRWLGTIDRRNAYSAGSLGFVAQHPRLVEWRWQESDIQFGHRGNHVAYLGDRWQSAHLVAALHPCVDAANLARRWRNIRASTGL